MKSQRWITIALFVLIGIVLTVAIICGQTPFDVNKVDTSTISAEDIAKTIAHRNELHAVLVPTLNNASSDVKAAAQHVGELDKQIQDQAKIAAQVPALEKKVGEAHAAAWRNLILGLGAGVILGLFGPKLLPLLASI